MGPGPDCRDRRSGLERETNGRVRPAMGIDFPLPGRRKRIYRRRIFRRRVYRKRIFRRRIFRKRIYRKRIYRKRIYRKRKTAHN